MKREILFKGKRIDKDLKVFEDNRDNRDSKKWVFGWVKKGFIAAGLMNIGGVLLFSRAFTNTAINTADPVVRTISGGFEMPSRTWHSGNVERSTGGGSGGCVHWP